MMARSERLLLVEGMADKRFFEAVCKLQGLDTNVQVAPPMEVGGHYNSKEGVFNHLSVLIKQLGDGRLKRLGLVVDADYKAEYGLGFERTVDRVTEIVTPFGFGLARNVGKPQGGLVFQHSDGLADLGLWVMPDNQKEGMLEDWIKDCIIQAEQLLFQHATKVIESLAQPKFKSIHRSKAEVATWLAWQETPGHGLYYALKEQLLDPNNTLFLGLTSWLAHMYR
jgi:hypothetical protein